MRIAVFSDVHGNLPALEAVLGDIKSQRRKMNEYLFEDRPTSSFQRLAASSNADVIVFGYTHVPYTKTADGVLFVNVGSVGKPKDGDTRACYAVLDLTAAPAATFRRVDYDIRAAAYAIRQTDLPHKFARDLELGGAPAAADTSAHG